MASLTNLELLKIEVEGSFDHRDRIKDLYGVTIACSETGQALYVGADVPDRLADELIAAFDPDQESNDLELPPAAVEDCRAILRADDHPLLLSADVSYLIENDSRFVPDSQLELRRSAGSDVDGLRDANPGNWHPVEWDDLLEGKLGVWVMALEGPVVVSLCHTAG